MKASADLRVSRVVASHSRTQRSAPTASTSPSNTLTRFPTDDSGAQVRRPLCSLLSLTLLLASITAVPAGAEETPEETIRQAREEREEARAQRAETAKGLDLLEAEDEEMLAALVAINDQLEAQEARIVEAQALLDFLTDEVGSLNDGIILTRQRSEILRRLGVERLVAAYVQPEEPLSTSILNGTNLHETTRRRTVFRFATLNDIEIRDELRAVDDDLVVLEVLMESKQVAAAIQEDLLQTTLSDLATNHEAQKSLRSALGERIDEIESQLDDMDAQERGINALIRQKQAEIAARDARNRQPDLDTVSPAGLIKPAGGYITSGFGSRRHPILGTIRNHRGVDISGARGNPVWAAQTGTVISAGRLGGYGNAVIIDHGGYTTLYAHMSTIRVSSGQRVPQGTRIGDIGSTGLSTGPHLHFEVRLGGVAVNPARYLPG
jgi:murein DD-endopeptidase MepM/ murein hydrolase activator NlpD